MTSDAWQSVTLDEVAEVTVGHVGPMASEYVESGVPFLRSQNVAPLRIVADDLKFISESFHERLRKSALAPGDVVIVRTGRPGACAVIPEWMPVANCSDLVIVRCGKTVDPRFLAYYVNSQAQHHVRSHLVGAVQQHFNVASAKQLVLRLPPLKEQQHLVRILVDIDAKLELNRRLNETLETMAASWFDEMFGEAATVGDDGAAWEHRPFTETVAVLGGGTPKTSVPEYWNGEVPWFSVADAPRLSDVWVLATEKTITEEALAKSAAQLVAESTTILSARGTVGRVALAGVPMAFNQSCYGLRGTVGDAGFYTYYATRDIVTLLQQRAHGSVFDTITRNTLDGISVRVPPVERIRAFEDKVRPLLERVRGNLHESENLAQARDALLPRLVTGDLRVPRLGC